MLVSVENWWYSYHLFLLLMSLLIKDVAKLQEVHIRKPDEILPRSVLLAYKQVEGQEVDCSDLLNNQPP
jgi:hypothetical protein